jgi:transcription initiation factor TFIID subunit 1
MNLIVNNCITYNGFTSELTKTAQKLLESCNEEIKQNDKELEQLEHEINPLLGDDPQAAISFLCRKCVERMKTVQSSWPFHFPVSSKKLPDYHMIITRPMDLQTMKKKCELDQYGNRVEFTADINQIVDNSITYNGPTSPFTQTAQTMREVGLQYLQEKAEYFDQYEPLLMSPEASASVQGSNYDVSEQGNSYVLSGEEEEVLSSEVMSMDMTESILLDSGHVPANNSGNTTEIDVEGLDNEEASLLPVKGGMDILREDLQYSSTSSSNEDSDIGDI